MRVLAGLDFVTRCEQEPDLQKAIDDFLASIKIFGFLYGAGGGWTGFGARRVYRFYFNNRPQDWRQPYEIKRLFDVDPFPLEAGTRRTTFLLTEEERRFRSFSQEANDLVDAALAYGWREVMGIPIHGPGDYVGLVTMSSKEHLSLSAADRAVIQAMANAIHERCHKTIGFGRRTKPMATLTARELECMRWVAAGKSDAEIASIVGISFSTAHFHVEKVKKKLETKSRTEAVALLLLDGLL
ncbi:MAG: LuxR C-terminal-related transcriptional regulator [Reyranellaceae bacterium]